MIARMAMAAGAFFLAWVLILLPYAKPKPNFSSLDPRSLRSLAARFWEEASHDYGYGFGMQAGFWGLSALAVWSLLALPIGLMIARLPFWVAVAGALAILAGAAAMQFFILLDDMTIGFGVSSSQHQSTLVFYGILLFQTAGFWAWARLAWPRLWPWGA